MPPISLLSNSEMLRLSSRLPNTAYTQAFSSVPCQRRKTFVTGSVRILTHLPLVYYVLLTQWLIKQSYWQEKKKIISRFNNISQRSRCLATFDIISLNATLYLVISKAILIFNIFLLQKIKFLSQDWCPYNWWWIAAYGNML